MKKSLFTFLLLSLLLLIPACKHKSEPIINVKFDVTNLTERKFSEIVTYGLKDPKKEDFKVIDFSADIDNSYDFSNIEISFPSADQIYIIANSSQIERLWCFYQTLSTKDSTKFVFYYKGLDENDFKKMFSSLKVMVTWDTKTGEHNKKSISVDNYIKFK